MNNRGFTLIELAIAIVIVGLLLVPAIKAYSLYVKQKKIEVTYENIEKITGALDLFHAAFDRYPVPADITRGVNDLGYGQEGTIPAVGFCTSGVCSTPGRDGNNDGNPDNILIGGIPDTEMRDLVHDLDARLNMKLGFKDTLDGWGRKITYVVTENLTNAGTYDDAVGAISVDKDVAGESLIDPSGSAHYMLISHGDDGLGAYTEQGNLYLSCDSPGIISGANPDGSLPPPTGNESIDSENCDEDNVFVNGVRSDVGGSNYYDDIVFYSVRTLSALWAASPENPDNIMNRNIGNVGIGTTDPEESLHIVGNVRADDVQGRRMCDDADPDNVCFDAEMIGGTVISCDGQALIEIAEEWRQCASVAFTISDAICPAGQVMTGISTNGEIECETP